MGKEMVLDKRFGRLNRDNSKPLNDRVVAVLCRSAHNHLKEKDYAEIVRHLCSSNGISHIARGLSAIHREGLFHGDLHPQNILFQNGRILITDLGVIFSGADNAYELAKMPNSQIKAPELFNSIKSENRAVPSQCTDYWAFAVNGLFILDGKFPFSTDFDTSGTGRSWSEISDSEREEFRQNVYKNIQRYHARIMTRLRRGYKYLSEDCRVAIRTGLYINPGKRNNAGKMIEEL